MRVFTLEIVIAALQISVLGAAEVRAAPPTNPGEKTQRLVAQSADKAASNDEQASVRGQAMANPNAANANAANSAREVPPGLDSAGDQDWPSFLGILGNSKSAERDVVLNWPANGPPVVWQTMLGAGYGSCVISNECCYQFDRVEGDARLRCLSRTTGLEKWTYKYRTDYEDLYGYDDGPRCCPVVDDGRVFLLGPAGQLHCVRASDGKRIWMVDTQFEFGVVQNFFGVGSTPIVCNDLLLVMVGGSPPDQRDVRPGQLDGVRGDGSGIVAFDKRTGKVRYQISDELASYASLRVVRRKDRFWGFAFMRGGLIGFDPVQGTLDFRLPWRARLLESVNASSPVVVGDRVFISETYELGSCLLKFRPGGYDMVWRDDPDSRDKSMMAHWNTPVHHEGYLYGCSGRHARSAELRCIEWATGKVMWREPRMGRTSLLYVDGHFIVLGEDGILRVIRATPDKFELVAESRLANQTAANNGNAEELITYPAWAAPVLSHKLLYVRGSDRLVCLNLRP